MWDNRQAFSLSPASIRQVRIPCHVTNRLATYRAVVHCVIPGKYKETRRGVRTFFFGVKRTSYHLFLYL